MRSYSWPGNIRELRNVIDRAVLLCTGSAITPEHLPVEKMTSFVPTYASGRLTETPEPPVAASSPADAGERRRILDALARTGGNQSEAAKLLHISRGTLLSRMERYDLPRPRKGSP